MNFKDPDLKLPPGTIIIEPQGLGLHYLILSNNKMIRVWSDDGSWSPCTSVPNYNFYPDTKIVYQPTEPFKVGDKIKAENLQKLPLGSIVRFPKKMCKDYLYLICEDANLYRLDSTNVKIHKYGFDNQPLYIEYIGETS